MLGPVGSRRYVHAGSAPAADTWPVMNAANLDYPEQLNAAVELTDRMVERGFGDHTALIGMAAGAPTRSSPTGPTASRGRWWRITAFSRATVC